MKLYIFTLAFWIVSQAKRTTGMTHSVYFQPLRSYIMKFEKIAKTVLTDPSQLGHSLDGSGK